MTRITKRADELTPSDVGRRVKVITTTGAEVTDRLVGFFTGHFLESEGRQGHVAVEFEHVGTSQRRYRVRPEGWDVLDLAPESKVTVFFEEAA